jgi:2-polyprenyl-3-methyl-5-hydroxy-6-metoxy-1,4-benzoquinol methylase
MSESPDERFYATLYLEEIYANLPSRSGLRILDAGCQAGRITVPLARAGHTVTAVEMSPYWLDKCRTHCQQAGVRVNLICDELTAALSRFAPGEFDVAICTEVLYSNRDCTGILKGIRAVLRDEGRLIASHRTPYYYVVTLAKYRRFGEAKDALTRHEGIVMGSYFNWFSEDELNRIYAETGFVIEKITGIGTLSGYGVDGLAEVVRPSDLTDDERQEFLRLEQLCAVPFRQAARYLLVSAKTSPAVRGES